jgi:adenylate kinase
MGTGVDFVIDVYVPDKEIIKRLTGRRICQACGTTFHMLYSPPQNEGKCDNCGGSLIRRADDDEETISKRLETYHRQTEPLIEHYERKGKLIRINGEGSIGDTSRELLKVLGAE